MILKYEIYMVCSTAANINNWPKLIFIESLIPQCPVFARDIIKSEIITCYRPNIYGDWGAVGPSLTGVLEQDTLILA